jgi:uncharacterized protein (TIGR02757 family)
MATAPAGARVGFDPVRFPHRYSSQEDVEVAGLLAACLAYGRVDLFAAKIESLLGAMGSSPADFVGALTLPRARSLLSGFTYRFNVGADLAVLLLGARKLLRRDGDLEASFVRALAGARDLHGTISAWTAALRDVPLASIERALGPARGLDHLLPSPLGSGAAKRLNLFLRWMVRGPDGVDFGIWKGVSPSSLLIPLDTHIGRIAKRLGLTRRNDLSWRTAEEVTASLRQVDPNDPVRFDFALCHYGMSGVCPTRAVPQNCARCLLRPACTVGRRLTTPSTRKSA